MGSTDGGIGRDRIGVVVDAAVVERPSWAVLWTVEKYDDDIDQYPSPEAFYAAHARPDEVVTARENLLLNEGITRVLNLIAGTTTNPYSNAAARIGTGTSNTAAAASQTALQAGGVFKAMDATYPTVSAQTITFRGTFGGSDANQAWEEVSVDNGSTPNENLNRKVQALGTKGSGTTWVLSCAITLA